MEFKDVVFGRRSIRRYTQEPVSDEDLQYILDAGLYAPSGVDLQPWYFVVIRSKEQMEKLASFTGRMSDQLTDVLRGRFQKHPEVAEESLRFIRQLGGAIFCERRYGAVFTFHNGADSYYSVRGWRGVLEV